MQQTVNRLPNSEVEVTVTLDAKDLKKFSDVVYERLKKEITASGFRPGKAPRFIVEAALGQERWNKEVLETSISMSFFDAVHAENLLTITPPDISLVKYVPGQELEYKAKVAVMPEISLPDYRKVKVELKRVDVSDDEIAQAIANLQRSSAALKPKEGPAEAGDKVEIDFESKVNDQPVEKGKSENHPLVIGEGAFLPDFEANLTGMRKGEEKNFSVNFPTDYHAKDLAGKKVDFTVKMNLVYQLIPPPIDDAFARALGKYQSLAELKERIREGISLQKGQMESMRADEEILTALEKEAGVELPEALISTETERMLAEIEEDLGGRGLSLSQYLSSRAKNFDDFKVELRSEAERRLKISLILTAVAKEEKIEASKEEEDREIEKTLSATEVDRDEAAAKLKSEDGRKDIRSRIIARKTMDKLRELCLVK